MIGLNVPDKEAFLEIKSANVRKMEQFVINITRQKISESEKRYRIELINSLAGIRQVSLIGTKSKSGEENLAIFNSLIHLGSDPSLFGLITRPSSVDRHTLTNILESKSYTLNFMTKKFTKQAHQTSARYPKEVSEFQAVNLTPEYLENCFSPFVLEAEVKIELKLEQIIDIEINGTKMIIGSIENIFLPEERLAVDGLIKFDDLLVSGGLDAYYKAHFWQQLPYAKP